MSKIIIKGINSSLFLSNEWTEKDSPQKAPVVNVNVINTSDSVRDLKKEMHKTIVKNLSMRNEEINSDVYQGTVQNGRVSTI